MANLLYLVHRLPYPPNKGDKVRSYHLLKHLAARHRVFTGTFVDDADDERYVGTVAALCSDLHAVRLRPRMARLASTSALFHNEAMTLSYYRDAGLGRWVDRTCREHRIDAAIVFSSAMAPYVAQRPQLPMVVDFVDVDSAKWTEYAGAHRWPLAWLYRREGRLLLAHERATALRARQSYFVTANEAALFSGLAPESASSVDAMCNGVDSDYFSVDRSRRSPFESGVAAANDDASLPIVFTGAMDYWPNIDAVCWFAEQVMPTLRRLWPNLRFYIVGRNPSSAVKALAGDGIAVTGAVDDIRPYLQHAAAVVAPLRLARGIQNKVLEAMAMERPVVASASCAEAIDAEAGSELLAATAPAEFVRQIDGLLRDPALARRIGLAARECVLHRYSWKANLAGIDRCLDAIAAPAST